MLIWDFAIITSVSISEIQVIIPELLPINFSLKEEWFGKILLSIRKPLAKV